VSEVTNITTEITATSGRLEGMMVALSDYGGTNAKELRALAAAAEDMARNAQAIQIAASVAAIASSTGIRRP
jgi:hypothetical protein